MQSDILKEHEWLQKFLGDWSIEGEGDMGPGQPPHRFSGTESVRSIGGFWIQGESRGSMPDDSPTTMQLTLGYDALKQRYVGTWLGSMMSHLWIYEGSVDAGGSILTLDTTGPVMDGSAPGKMTRYQDIFEFKGPDHRILTSQLLRDDGQWQRFMSAHYRRR
jgi:hypothetical protein